MNSHIPVKQPTRRVPESQRKSSRQLDGFSTHKTLPIQSLSKPDLQSLREKTRSMLENATIMATLPDHGARLKEKLQLIDTLLDDTPETVTERVSKMTLEEEQDRPNIRKKSVADANLEACRVNLSSNLLQAHATHSGSNDMEDTVKDDRQQAKVRMISLDESVRLQDTQRDRIKEEGFKKQLEHLKSNSGDDISTTMSRMRLDHGGQSDDDDDDDDDDDSDYNYDSAYEEDEGSNPDEGYGQDDYYQQR